MTSAYKFYYDDIEEKVEQAAKQIGDKKPLDVFVRSLLSIIKNRNGYLKFGVYWYAAKEVLKRHSKADLGDYSVEWLKNEYQFADDGMGTPKKIDFLRN